MWFLLFFIVVPFVFFLGFYLSSIIVIFLVNKIFRKKYSWFLSLILPCLFLIFYFMLIMGGISFKFLDPQYYEFKSLCEKAENVVYDEELYRIYSSLNNKTSYPKKYYDEKTKKEYITSDFPNFDTIRHKISERLFEYQNFVQYENKIFLYYQDYFYHYHGIFLKGDEGAGWRVGFNEEVLNCEDVDEKFTGMMNLKKRS